MTRCIELEVGTVDVDCKWVLCDGVVRSNGDG